MAEPLIGSIRTGVLCSRRFRQRPKTLREKLATLTEDTRTALSTQADSDWSTLQGLIGDARAKMNTIRGRVGRAELRAARS